MKDDLMTTLQQMNALKSVDSEKRDEYLTELMGEYKKTHGLQTAVSSIANLAGIGMDIMSFKKTRDQLKVPEFNVPTQTSTQIRRTNLMPRYESFAARTLNTGVQAAREMGRPDLIPGVLRQTGAIEEEGILKQAELDIQTSNQQAVLDAESAERFKARQQQAEGALFETEYKNNLALGALWDNFSTDLSKRFSAQAEITNKSMADPLQTKLDWLTNFGYIDQSIFDKSETT